MLEKTKKLTVRFPKRLKEEMQYAIIHSGYGLHGKSRWLQEALQLFLLHPDFVDLVEHGLQINQGELTEIEAFYLPSELTLKLHESLLKTREHYPMLEGVQSAFIRAAVIYRLMFKEKFPNDKKIAY